MISTKEVITLILLCIAFIGKALPTSFIILEKDQSEYISKHVRLAIYYNQKNVEDVEAINKLMEFNVDELDAREQIFRKLILYLINKPISYNVAFDHIESAVKEAEFLAETDVLKGLVCQVFAGFLFENRADEQAIEFIQKAIRLLKPYLTDHVKYNLTSKLCFAYENMGAKDSVEVTYARILEFTKDNKDRITYASANNNYGLYLTKNGAFGQAISVFQNGINHLNEDTKNEHIFIANIMESMSHAYYKKGDQDHAIQLLEDVIAICAKYNYGFGTFSAFNYAVNYLDEMQAHQKAIQLYHRFKYILEKPNPKLEQYAIYYSGRAKVHRFLNNLKISEQLNQKADEIKFEESNTAARLLSQRTNMNAFFNTKNRLVKAELANEILQRKKELQDRRIMMLIVSILFLSALVMFFMYRYRVKAHNINQARLLEISNQKEEILKLNNENLAYQMRLKESDLSLIAADNRFRTSIKKEFLKKLKNLEGLSLEMYQKELLKLRIEVEQTIDSQEKLSLMQDSVDEINAAFETKLRKKIPEISPSEIQLCSYLKLGMDNKQIAQLTSKSVGSIRVYRSRLRKKAGILTAGIFEAFLKEL